MRASRATIRRGFTLVELMIASVIAAGLAYAGFEVLRLGMEFSAENEARLRINEQARASFRTLVEGGRAAPGQSGDDGTRQVYGLRASVVTPSDTTASGGQLLYQNNGLLLSGDEVPSFEVQCTGMGEPIATCPNASDTVTVRGWVQDVSLDTASLAIDGRTIDVVLALADPMLLRRPTAKEGAASDRIVLLVRRIADDPAAATGVVALPEEGGAVAEEATGGGGLLGDLVDALKPKGCSILRRLAGLC